MRKLAMLMLFVSALAIGSAGLDAAFALAAHVYPSSPVDPE